LGIKNNVSNQCQKLEINIMLSLCETLCLLCDSLWNSYYTKLLREAQSCTKIKKKLFTIHIII